MVPTPGRIVFYVDTHGDKHPALVTKVHTDEAVNLTFFPDEGDPAKHATSVLYDGDFGAQEAVGGIEPERDDAGEPIPGTGWAGTPAREARSPRPHSWHWPPRG